MSETWLENGLSSKGNSGSLFRWLGNEIRRKKKKKKKKKTKIINIVVKNRIIVSWEREQEFENVDIYPSFLGALLTCGRFKKKAGALTQEHNYKNDHMTNNPASLVQWKCNAVEVETQEIKLVCMYEDKITTMGMNTLIPTQP